MKINKILVGLLVALAIVLVPRVSLSKTDGPETIVLTGDNTLVLNSEVNGDSVGALIMKAKELDGKLSGRLGINKEPLYLYLNTPGGSIQSGLELIETLKGLGRPIHTVTAFSASMGFQIAENLGNRYILKSGVMMSHRASGQFEGSFGGTGTSQLEQRIHLMLQTMKELDEQTVKRTNGKQTLESYQKSYDHELWLTAQESMSAGYSDAIIVVKCDKTLTGTTKHQVSFMGVNISYEQDNCPLNTALLNIQVGSIAGASAEYITHIKNQFLSTYQAKASTPLPMIF